MNIAADGNAREVRDHGGSLAKAEALFPGAPKPWIDCSTGINPHPYPFSLPPASAWRRLPEADAVGKLRAAAALAYGAPSPENLVAAPGTQILLPAVARLIQPGRARILGPTYAEHRRCAALAGHAALEVADVRMLADADLAVVVNPNNPDGQLHGADALLALAAKLRARAGLLVVDEAFMDEAPGDFSLSPHVEKAGNIVVLRSFGKFFGLAGVRLGFMIASRERAARLEAELGPWAVSGPAVEIGRQALADRRWQKATRRTLRMQARRLDGVLSEAGLEVAGGTSLFRFVQTPDAQAIFQALGQAGIYVRRFDAMLDALRIGLPPDDAAFARLSEAFGGWRRKVSNNGAVR
jgi:cobalamin biosynthesis protein CobC